MKRILTFFTFIALALWAFPSHASHIAGADLSYECQGSGVYLINLDLTRDCGGIAAPASANVLISTSGCGNLQANLAQVSNSFPSDFCWSQQTTCNNGNNPGFERIRYQGIVTLPSNCGIADLSYNLCCRNPVATNVTNPSANDLYVEAQINTTVCNNGPDFPHPSSLVVCDGQAVTIYAGGLDPDGDSLVYSLATPLGSSGNPLMYAPGFSAGMPLSTTGGVAIDPLTGEISFTPNGIQAGVIAVNVKEYRNGQLVGQSNRDFTIMVVSCAPGNTAPFQSAGPSNITGGSLVAANHLSVCTGTALSFDISFDDNDLNDSLGYTTPAGLPSGMTSSYTGWQPIDVTLSWTPTTPGTYYIPIKVTDIGCPLRLDATAVIRIDVLDGTTAGPDQTICSVGGSVQLQAIGGSSFTWSPTTGLSNPNIANPIASPSATTSYVVTSNLAAGCTNTDTVTVFVNPSNVSVTAMNDTTFCSSDSIITLTSTSNAPVVYWSSLGGQPIGTTPNWVTFNPGQATSYVVTALDTNGCEATDTVNIGVSNIFVNVTTTNESCSQSDGTALAIPSGSNGPFTFSWSNGTNANPATGLSSATYGVTVTDQQGCEGTGFGFVQNQGVFLNAIFQNPGFCQGDSALVYLSGTVFGPQYSVSVSPNYNIDSAQPNTFFVFPDTTTRYIFTVTDTSGCSASDTILVNVQPALTVDLGGDTTLCGVNVVNLNATLSGGTGVGNYSWQTNFATLDTNGTSSNTATLSNAAWVSVFYSDSNGCSATDFINIDLDSACYSYLGGTVYADVNGNCTADTNDFGLANVMIEATDGGVSIFDFTDASGNYNFQVGNGSWDIIQHEPAYYDQICPIGNHNVLISGPGTVNPSLHFYDTLQGVNDLRISNSIWVIRPGFQRWGTMYICNDGNTTANGYVNLINPPGVTMVWAPHTSPSSIVPDTYNAASGLATWNFSNLAPGACFSIHYHYVGDTNLTIPQNLPFVAQVYPQTGDATPLNNIDVDSVPVSNSYDPNDKAVTPAGAGPDGEITIDQNTLQYRIRFQNTGNDTAYLVVLKDTLDQDLNVESIKMLASSHDYDARIDSNRILTFTFEDIYLPDSMTDPEGSQGFVLFEVGIDNPQIGTVVKNQAAIYFDFNPPIFTNTVTNTIVEKSVGIADVENSQFEIFPNPTRGNVLIRSMEGEEIQSIHVFDLSGKLVRDVHAHGKTQMQMDLRELSTGVYLIEVSSERGTSVERIVIE